MKNSFDFQRWKDGVVLLFFCFLFWIWVSPVLAQSQELRTNPDFSLGASVPIGYRNSTPILNDMTSPCASASWSKMPLINVPNGVLGNGYYQVEISSFADFDEIGASSDWVQGIQMNLTFHTVSGSTYYYRLRARPDLTNSNRISRYSTIRSCTPVYGKSSGTSIIQQIVDALTPTPTTVIEDRKPESPPTATPDTQGHSTTGEGIDSSDGSRSRSEIRRESIRLSEEQVRERGGNDISLIPIEESEQSKLFGDPDEKRISVHLNQREFDQGQELLSAIEKGEQLTPELAEKVHPVHQEEMVLLEGRVDHMPSAIIAVEVNSDPVLSLTSNADANGSWKIEFKALLLQEGFHTIDITAINPVDPTDRAQMPPQVLYRVEEIREYESTESIILGTDLTSFQDQLAKDRDKKQLIIHAFPVEQKTSLDIGRHSISALLVQTANIKTPFPLKIKSLSFNPKGEVIREADIYHDYKKDVFLDIPLIIEDFMLPGDYTIFFETQYENMTARTSIVFRLIALDDTSGITNLVPLEESSFETPSLRRDYVLNYLKPLVTFTPLYAQRKYFASPFEEILFPLVTSQGTIFEGGYFSIPGESVLLSDSLYIVPAQIRIPEYHSDLADITRDFLAEESANLKVQTLQALEKAKAVIVVPRFYLLDSTFELSVPIELVSAEKPVVYRRHNDGDFYPVARAHVDHQYQRVILKQDSGGLFSLVDASRVTSHLYWKPSKLILVEEEKDDPSVFGPLQEWLGSSQGQGNQTNLYFTDITPEWSWSEPFINYLYEYHVINGRSPAHYAPGAHISRGELAKIVLNAFGYFTPDEITGIPFPDVQQTDWEAPYILRATQAGIISGYPDGTAKHRNPVNRVEALAMMIRAMKFTIDDSFEGDVPFPDVDAQQWYFPFVRFAYENGIVSGYQNGLFGVDDSLSRAAAAKMVYNLLGYERGLVMGD